MTDNADHNLPAYQEPRLCPFVVEWNRRTIFTFLETFFEYFQTISQNLQPSTAIGVHRSINLDKQF
ncbi:MAG: hypothetical protein EBU88_03390 [Acidobacteria bacterium]|nr:hypothetical protein [Acidobacteriota bacterium]